MRLKMLKSLALGDDFLSLIIGELGSGKTTLLKQISKWWESVTGKMVKGHDHFTFYGTGSNGKDPLAPSSDELKRLWALTPRIKRGIQRDSINYHLGAEWLKVFADWILVGFHIEEAVYAPMYYGYEREGFVAGIEQSIRRDFLGAVLVLVKASPAVIAKRMRENPHSDNIIKEKDIELVLKGFNEEYKRSLIYPKFVLDTSNKTPRETLNEFIKSMTPLLCQRDRIRMLYCKSLGRK